MKRASLVTVAACAAAIAGLVALAAPVVQGTFSLETPPQLADVGIDTLPGDVQDLLLVTGLSDFDLAANEHEDVDAEYVRAARVWPWDLPPGWRFPLNRNVPDTPGAHWEGMGVKAAYAKWASATLDAVKNGDLAPDDAGHLLDELEDATTTFLGMGLLTDSRFVEREITPLRPE